MGTFPHRMSSVESDVDVTGRPGRRPLAETVLKPGYLPIEKCDLRFDVGNGAIRVAFGSATTGNGRTLRVHGGKLIDERGSALFESLLAGDCVGTCHDAFYFKPNAS